MEENKQELAVVSQLPIITQRLKEVSDDIKQRTQTAMSIVVTEDNIADVKKIRAGLNKEFTEYENVRKTIKKQIMQPYDEFNVQYEEYISSAFKNADKDLKGKIDEGEQKIKDEKEQELHEYFEELRESMHLENIVRWYDLQIKVNLSDSQKKLKEQVNSKLDAISNEVKLIELEEYADDIMLEYQKDFNFSRAKLEVLNRVAEKKRLEEERLKRQQQEEQDKQLEQKVEEAEDDLKIPEEIVTLEEEKKETEFATVFKVVGTRDQIVSVRNFMVENNIKFENV